MSTPILVEKSVFRCLQINGFNGVYNILVKNKSIDFSVVKKVLRYQTKGFEVPGPNF